MSADSGRQLTLWERQRQTARATYAIGAVLLLFSSPAWLMAASAAFDDWSHRRPFDSAVWKEGLSKESTDPVRLRMIDDLLKKKPLVNMSRAEIVLLLGTPPKTGYFHEYEFVYWLGPERGFFSIDSEWLAIRFNSEDRVSDARVVSD